MIRCCLCREKPLRGSVIGITVDGVYQHAQFEPTDLPGSGWRCIDHGACAERVREIVLAHRGLLEIVGSDA